MHEYSLCTRVFVVCSTKTCPTTGWTGWASRPPCTETRTAPGPCRRCTSTTGPSCTPTSIRTPPTPTPCLPVWAPLLTTLSREIKTLYTGRCKPPVRRETHSLADRRASRPGGGSQSGLEGTKSVLEQEKHRLNARDGRASRWSVSAKHWSPNYCRGAGKESGCCPFCSFIVAHSDLNLIF